MGSTALALTLSWPRHLLLSIDLGLRRANLEPHGAGAIP